MPLLTGGPRASLAWEFIFFWTALVIFPFSGLTIGSVQGKYFQVEVLYPQYFKITPRVQGSVSAVHPHNSSSLARKVATLSSLSACPWAPH
jgi:hypothetical protein